ncbi:MAG: hypothetical protein A2Y77_05770 [Planctomycetes bacterium RBG_13_62_9]|nr:MAG: hypothetical protein A2Y77_05770 [Planctomycetes bacterium RBG_13_62_9]
MTIPKAQIIKRNGKKEFAVLPYADFLKIQEALEDYEDLRCLREAKEMERGAPTVGLAGLRRSLRGRAKRSSKDVRTRRRA